MACAFYFQRRTHYLNIFSAGALRSYQCVKPKTSNPLQQATHHATIYSMAAILTTFALIIGTVRRGPIYSLLMSDSAFRRKKQPNLTPGPVWVVGPEPHINRDINYVKDQSAICMSSIIARLAEFHLDLTIRFACFLEIGRPSNSWVCIRWFIQSCQPG